MAEAVAVAPPSERNERDDDERDNDLGHPAFVWCFMAFLVTNMLAGRTDLGLPIGPDRLFFAAGAVLFLLDRRYSLRELRLGSVHLVALLVVCIAGLSALNHGILTTSYGFFALLDRLLVPYLVFAVAPVAFKREADRLLILKTLTLVGIYLGLTAMAEIFGPHALVFPRYILDPSVGGQFGRARGPFAESEANGLTLLAALWCAVTLARNTVSRRWRYVAVASVALSVIGSMLTLTRSIWLGLCLGVLVVAFVDRRARRFLIPGALALVAIVGIALLSLPTLSDKANSRFNDSGSVYDRRNTAAAAVRAIEEHPLTGLGWVQFISVSGHYVRQNPDYPVTVTDIEIHNVVLSRTAELGIPGGVLWLLSVILGPAAAALRRPLTSSARTWRFVLLGTASGWAVAVMSSPVPYPLPNTLVWLFSGLALAPALVHHPDRESRGRV